MPKDEKFKPKPMRQGPFTWKKLYSPASCSVNRSSKSPLASPRPRLKENPHLLYGEPALGSSRASAKLVDEERIAQSRMARAANITIRGLHCSMGGWKENAPPPICQASVGCVESRARTRGGREHRRLRRWRPPNADAPTAGLRPRAVRRAPCR